MMKYFIILLIAFSSLSIATAQQSKDGVKTINTGGVILNEYTFLTASAASGLNSINVSNASLNSNGRFSGPLATGDMILIIQMQGASLNTANDSTWGEVASYNNAGNYEFAEVASVSGNTIQTACPLKNSYTSTGKVQVIRVPRYSSLSIGASGSVTSPAWNGLTGGIVAAESAGNILIDGVIDVSGKGFRGGAIEDGAGGGYTGYANADSTYGAEKGEGIAGYKTDYEAFGGRYGRGAPANGGGGGNSHNAPGGGGGNAGLIAYTGNGNPDITTNPTWISAWNVEYPGFANSVSSGGGRGGCSLSEKDADALTYAPGDWYYWRGDGRQSTGGKGGRPLDYTSGKIFLGGGGGAGDANQGEGGRGGSGGGLVFLTACGQISGAASGKIVSNGEAAPDVVSFSSGDAVGGGGAGGTIILNAKSGVAGISLIADGGKGANHIFNNGGVAYGPGGGGGGGYIAITSGNPVRSAKGGVNGITTSNVFSEFPPNSATKGGYGIDNAIFTLPSVEARDTSICSGSSVVLKAFYKNGFSGGAINWYKTSSRNSFISIGATLTTGNLFKDTVFYVGACFNYCTTPLVPVKVKITGAGGKYAGNDKNVCSGDSVILGEPSVASYNYQWSPANGLNSTTDARPLFTKQNKGNSPVIYTYYLSAGNGSCLSIDTVTITVNPMPLAEAGRDTSICSGNQVKLGAPSKNGYSYSWSPASKLVDGTVSQPLFSGVNAGPAPVVTSFILTTTFNGCKGYDTVNVAVTSVGGVTEAGPNKAICTGEETSLGSAPVNNTIYSWTPSTGLDNVAISNPNLKITNNGNSPFALTYYLSAKLNGCESKDSVVVTVKPKPRAFAGRDTSVCSGAQIQLGEASSPGVVYAWNPGSELSNSTISNPALTKINNGSTSLSDLYILKTSLNGCENQDTVRITSMPVPDAYAGRDTSLCAGAKVKLGKATVSGVLYSWSPSQQLSNNTIHDPLLTADNLGKTEYIITANLNGCKQTDTVSITVKTKPLAFAGRDTSICSGAKIQLGEAPSPGVAYSWSPNSELSNSTISNPALTKINNGSTSISDLYILKTSLNGCENQDTVRITSMPIPEAYAGRDTSVCAGAKVKLGKATVSGVLYSWSPSQQLSDNTIHDPDLTADNVGKTDYVISANLNGCKQTDTISITVKPKPQAFAGRDTVVCSGSPIQLGEASTPGVTYAWSPGSELSNSTISNPTLTKINNGSTSISDLYILKTALNGCENQDTVRITSMPFPEAYAGRDTSVCAGAKVKFGKAGVSAALYSWSPSNGLNNEDVSDPLLTTTTGGTTKYILTANLNGCIKKDSVSVIVNQSPSAFAGNDTTICSGELVSVGDQKNALYQYNWNPALPGNPPQSNIKISNNSGNPVFQRYIVTTSLNGCSNSDSVNIVINPMPVANAGLDKQICSGEKIVLGGLPSNNVVYSWSPNNGLSRDDVSNPAFEMFNNTANVLVYDFILTASINSCVSKDTITVDVKPGPVANAGKDTSVCSGEYVKIGTASVAGYQYSWNPPVAGNTSQFNQQFINIQQIDKTYLFVQIANFNGCSDSDTVVITAKHFPLAEAGPSTVDVCSGNTVFLGSAPVQNVEYIWKPVADLSDPNSSQPLLTAVNTGNSNKSVTYLLSSTLNGCTSMDSIVVTIKPSPLAFAGNDSVACDTLSKVLGSSSVAGYNYQWSPTQFLTNPNSSDPILNLKNTTGEIALHTYTLKVNSNGCISEASVNFTIFPYPKTMNDTSVCFGADITLAAKGGSTYLWNTGDTTPSIMISPTVTTTYFVSIDGTCKATDTVTVIVKNENPNGLYIPNAFSPNDDGINDFFKAEGMPLKSFHAAIFNRWGEEVYSWDDLSGAWDGKQKGIPMQQDIYTYVIKAKNECDAEKRYSGIITIVK